jgi:hypothetical protein
MNRSLLAPILAILILSTVFVGHSLAQAPAASGGRSAPAPREIARPAWKDLSPSQKEALAPLAGQWDQFDRDRKVKWLEVANKYPQLSPDGQRRLHERMGEFTKLTPEQRRTARSNFQRAYELPRDQRESLVQQYQDMPPDKKRELAERAAKKAEPVRRKPAAGPERKPDLKPNR